MTIGELKELIPVLRESGVSTFRNGTTEIHFASKCDAPEPSLFSQYLAQRPVPAPAVTQSPSTGIKSELVGDVVVPTNLEEEPEMTTEQILFWGVDPDVKVRGTGTHDEDVMKRAVKLPEAPAEPKAPPQGEGEGNV